jgi:hypothetical protein
MTISSLGRTERRLVITHNYTLSKEGLFLERTNRWLGIIYNYTKVVPRELEVGIVVSNLHTARFP